MKGSVTVDDGKNQRAQPMLVSKDSRYLIVVMGGIIELHQNSAAEMAQRIRETFKTPANVKLSVGGFKPSPSPDFEQGTLFMDDGTAQAGPHGAAHPGWQTPDRQRSVQFGDRSQAASAAHHLAPGRTHAGTGRTPP